MVLGEAMAGAAAGAHALWSYNRGNFLYDRRMRQETEYKILEWRRTQAQLWRSDVRDIIGLTERKMDNYLIVSTLQLAMVLGLFTEGRLEPGTPPWLLHFYMLTLGAAFLYLLMSVWLAMHASIAATCSSVRLLTQFVRLPVPTWQQLESMRTYANSFETMEAGNMFRVPFTGRRPDVAGAPQTAAQSTGRDGVGSQEEEFVDPWCLEESGEQRELYELQEHPAALRRHVCLARRAAKQYQCFDAFARVGMSFGTIQLLHAIGYYCLGYAAVQDGAPWPAVCILTITSAIGVVLVQVDFALTRREQGLSQLLLVAGPFFSTVSTLAFNASGAEAEPILLLFLPLAYVCHGLWLFFALSCCGLELQPNGAILPVKFRAVLYLDVFGWLKGKKAAAEAKPCAMFAGKEYAQVPSEGLCFDEPSETPQSGSPELCAKLKEDLRGRVRLWRSQEVQQMMDDSDREQVQRLTSKLEGLLDEAEEPPPAAGAHSGQLVKLRTYTDLGSEVQYFYDPEKGETHFPHATEKGTVPGVIRTISSFAEGVEQFESYSQLQTPVTPLPPAEPTDHLEGNLVKTTSRIFEQTVEAARNAVTPVMKAFLDEEVAHQEKGDGEGLPSTETAKRRIAMTPSGEVSHVPLDAFAPDSYGMEEAQEDGEEIVTGHHRVKPGVLPARIFRLGTLLLVFLWMAGVALPLSIFRNFITRPLSAAVMVQSLEPLASSTPTQLNVMVGAAPDGLPQLIAGPSLDAMPELPESQLLSVTWPSHSGFVPRSLSCDPSGQQLVVADDFGVYTGQLIAEKSVAARSRRLAEAESLVVQFQRVPPCTALEGQALKDIGVVCSRDQPAECRVVVLHSRGRRLAECPLPDLRQPSATAAAGLPLVVAQPPAIWAISSDWLQTDEDPHNEYVESVAISTEGSFSDKSPMTLRADIAGSIVVGTSQGRIVQMRGAFSDPAQLVPERAMEERPCPVGRGSLHVFPGGLVMALRHNSSSVQAFDAMMGTSVGEWRLPQGVHWLTLAGGGEHLYILGQRNGTKLELHQFPVPPELQTQLGAARQQALWHFSEM